MANTAIHHTTRFGQVSESSEFSFLEQMILRRAHPVSVLFDLTGVIWFTFFLWEHQWQYALAMIVVERLLATTIVWNADLNSIAKTLLGKLGLLHLHPINLTVQIVGLAGTIWGIWTHSVLFLLLGLSVVILGHAFGWSEVHPSFSLHKKIEG